MSLPYFPMYPRDFEADTSHLTLEEDGAYNRLLRLCWMTPGASLPDDDAWIMRRMRVDEATFIRVVKVVLAEFFTRQSGRVSNARMTREFIASSDAHAKRVSAGKSGGNAKARKTNKSEPSNAKAMLKQPEPEPEPYKEAAAASAGATFREQILSAIGVDPVSGLTGHGGSQLGTQAHMAEASRWLELPGITEAVAVAEVARIAARRSEKPRSFSFFTDAMRSLSAALSAPKLSPAVSNGFPQQSDAETGQERILRLMRMGGINTEPMQ